MQTSYKEYLQACDLLKYDSAGTDLLEAFILSACDYYTYIGKDAKDKLTEALNRMSNHCINNYGFNPIKLSNDIEPDTFNNWIAELINTIFKNRIK